MHSRLPSPVAVSAAQRPEHAFAETDLGRRLLGLQASGSSSQRAVAEHLLRNPVRLVARSIEELAQETGVSTATISRFARQAGFGGYPEMRGAVAATLEEILQPVEKLRARLEQGGDAPLAQGLEATLANVRATAESLGGLGAAVARLAAARTVSVMGFGLSAHVAAVLALGLQPFCPTLVNVVEFGGTEIAAGRLMNAGPQDVLVAISFPRYASDAVHLARYAHDRGTHVIAITDSPASPLARVADQSLFAPSAHPILSSSFAGAMVAAEALVSGMMMSNRDNVAHAARLTDAISAYLYRGDGDRPKR